jgi:hypothetical protein
MSYLTGHYVHYSSMLVEMVRRGDFPPGYGEEECFRLLSATFGELKQPGPPLRIEVLAYETSRLVVIDGDEPYKEVEPGVSEIPEDQGAKLYQEIASLGREFEEATVSFPHEEAAEIILLALLTELDSETTEWLSRHSSSSALSM